MIWEIIKTIILGIVEGITEWLPISSTGHLILVEEFLKLDKSDSFKEMFEVVIQLGAIMAVVVLFWSKLFPFGKKTNNTPLSDKGLGAYVKKDIFIMWFKAFVACIPSIIVGLALNDWIKKNLYYPWVIAAALIIFGIAFIFVENWNKSRTPKINTIDELTYKAALIIGCFQLIAALFPGTSRSGATIIGALLIGISRTVAAEFTFYLAVPVMFGASLLEVMDFGTDFTKNELAVLAVGMITAFVVSLFVIKLLMGYIKKHDFKVFGWYRIILGILVLIYFGAKALIK